MSTRASRSIIVAVAAALLTTGTVLAATITWTGGGDGTSWNDAGNWGGTKPGANDEGVFTTSGTAGKTILLNGSQALGQLTISGNPTMAIGSATDASAGYTLTLSFLERNNYANAAIPTMTANVVVASGRASFPCCLDGGITTLAGNINGAGKTLEKYSGGTLVLSGTNVFGGVALYGGFLQMNSATAIGTAPVTFNGGTLQLFDNTDLSGRFSQAPNQYYSLATTSNVTFATPLTSVGGRLAKSGAGTLTLSVSNSYSGPTTVSAGTLTFSGLGSLGNTTAPLYPAGGTLDLGSASPLTVGTVYLSGGAIVTNGTLNGTFYSAYPSGNAYIPAILGGSGIGLTKWASAGTLSLRNANTYTGDTTVNGGGALSLEFNTGTSPATDIVNASSALKLGGGSVSLTGKATTRNNGQTVNGLTLNPGASSFSIASGASSNYTRLTLGAISRTAGGAVNFSLPTGNTACSPSNGYVTATANDASGILGAYATVGGSDWAANNGSFVTNYAGYATLSGNGPTITNGASGNVRLSNASTGVVSVAAGTTTINTLLVNDTATARTNIIGSGNVLRLGAVGGILVPSTSKGLTIDTNGGGGTLTAGGADSTPGELIINNAVTVTNNAVIADNGSGAVALTKAGAGTLVLGTNCTHSGGTFLNAGTLLLPGGTNPLSINGSVVVNGATLNLGGAIQTNTSPVSFQGNAAVTNGTIVKIGTAYEAQYGIITAVLAGPAGLNKTTPSTVTLTGPSANTYTGDTVITEGTLVAGVDSVDRTFVPGNLIVGSPIGGPSATYSTPNNAIGFNKAKNITVYTNGTANFGNGTQHLGNNGATVTIIGGTVLGNYIYMDGGTVYMTGGSFGAANGNLYAYGGNFYGSPFYLTTYSNATPANVTVGLNYSCTFTVADGPAPIDLNYSGLVGSSAKLTKAGAGLMTMNAASSTSAGINLTAGTLLVNNSFGSGTGQGTLTNAVGATLGGVGIIGGVAGYSNANVVLSSGASTNSMATLAPGTIDVNTGSHIFGTLTIGGSAQTNNIAFGKFTRLYVQLGAAPGSNDCLAVNGKIDLGSGSNTNYLDVGILSGTPKSGDYTLATFNVLTGRFFAVRSAPGTTLPKGWRLNYPGTGTGNGNELINGSIVFSIPGGGTALFMR